MLRLRSNPRAANRIHPKTRALSRALKFKPSCDRLEDRIALAVATWTGAVDSLWKTDGNWQAGARPNPGDSLVFPADVAQVTTDNDFDAGTQFDAITIKGNAGYILQGNAISLIHGVDVADSTATHQYALPTELGDGNFVVPAGAELIVRSVLSGTAGVTLTGGGALRFDTTSVNIYTGPTVVSAGTLQVDGSIAADSAAQVNGRLSGTGQVLGAATVAGSLRPGSDADRGAIQLGGLSFTNAGSLVERFTGLGGVISADKVVTSGAVTLSGATFAPVMTDYAPTPGDVLTVIDNQGSAAISGTFANVADGKYVTFENRTFLASYQGGEGGNDLTLAFVSDTTTQLAQDIENTRYGQNVVFSATVASTAGTPEGDVAFFDGGILLGTRTLAAGVASFETSALNVTGSPHAITAKYLGNGSFAPSESGAVSHTVEKAAASAALSSSLNPSAFGQEIMFTAVVSPEFAGAPTGTVQLFDGETALGDPIALEDGKATASVNSLAASAIAHAIKATYSGDSNFDGSDSNIVEQVVNAAETHTALSAAPNPAVVNQTVTLTAVVSAADAGAGTPIGTVEFASAGTPIDTVELVDGKAVLEVAFATLGERSITASYHAPLGGNFADSASDPASVRIDAASTTTGVSASANPSVFGATVTFTATVDPQFAGAAIPTGTVRFEIDGKQVGSDVPLTDGKASIDATELSAGTHVIVARYSGSDEFTASDSPDFNQNVNPASTGTIITSLTPNPSSLGQAVTIVALVAPINSQLPAPTGTVTFRNGSADLKTVALVDGEAALTTSDLPPGVNSITAVYNGSESYRTSTSIAREANVAQAPTVTTLSTSQSNAVYGTFLIFIARVGPAFGALVPTGTISFVVNGNPILTSEVSSNQTAAFPISGLPVGVHRIQVVYSGDANFAGSTSLVTTQSITLAPTTSALSTTIIGRGPHRKVRFELATAVNPPSGGIADGPVILLRNGLTYYSTGLNASGRAIVVIPIKQVKNRRFQLLYPGSARFQASLSPESRYGTAAATQKLARHVRSARMRRVDLT